MNNKRLNDGIKHIRKIGLSGAEKNLLFKNVLNYVDNNPVLVKNRSPYGGSFWSVNVFNRTSFASLIIILALAFGGVTVFAAESSLPGDLLYPIKVNVSEPIVDAVTFGKVSKIAREAEKADERLKEAEVLASQGRLNEESRKELENRFSEHTEKISTFIHDETEKVSEKSQVAKEKIDSVKTDFEKKVSEHTENLEKIKEKLPEGEKQEVETLKNNVLDKVKTEKEKSERRGGSDKKGNNKNEEIRSSVKTEMTTSNEIKDSGSDTSGDEKSDRNND